MIDSILSQQLVNGLTLGCLYALIALGYTLIFGVMRFIFFAQGELCMIGAFGAMGAVFWLGRHIPAGLIGLTTLAFLGAILVAVLVGLVAERLAIRPIRQAARTKQLIASLGVSMILQNLILLSVGAENYSFPSLFPNSAWSFLGARVTPIQSFVVAFSIFLMVGLHWILRATRLGLHLRAVSESAETAELDGIDVDRTIMMTFIVGSVLAASAGVMMGAYDGVVKYNMGFLPGIKGFTAAILGGFGRPSGAMLGGLVLGVSETIAAGYISSSYRDAIALALLVFILIVRPGGLVGKGLSS